MVVMMLGSRRLARSAYGSLRGARHRRRTSGRRRLGGLLAAGQAEADVLDMGHDLFQQVGDVVVVELVDDLAAITLAGHQPQMSQEPELMRDGGALLPNPAAEP